MNPKKVTLLNLHYIHFTISIHIISILNEIGEKTGFHYNYISPSYFVTNQFRYYNRFRYYLNCDFSSTKYLQR